MSGIYEIVWIVCRPRSTILSNIEHYLTFIIQNRTHSDECKSFPPWLFVSVIGTAEPSSFATVVETIRTNHYQDVVNQLPTTHRPKNLSMNSY